MLDARLTRRHFLHSGRNMLVGTLALNSGALGLLAPSQSWALPLAALDPATGRALLKAARHIFRTMICMTRSMLWSSNSSIKTPGPIPPWPDC